MKTFRGRFVEVLNEAEPIVWPDDDDKKEPKYFRVPATEPATEGKYFAIPKQPDKGPNKFFIIPTEDGDEA